jgi:hypothetical protein
MGTFSNLLAIIGNEREKPFSFASQNDRASL